MPGNLYIFLWGRMDFHHPIDIYCERTSAVFWAEPLNAISNLSFILAGAALLILYRHHDRGVQRIPFDSAALIFMVFVIGVGSFLFHTFANTWSMMMDVGPILVYQLFLLGFYARRVIGLNRYRTGMILLGFIVLGQTMKSIFPEETLEWVPDVRPGLSSFCSGMAFFMLATHQKERFLLLGAAGVFLVSLTFRSVDMTVCPALPVGVHYMWHLLNGILLYMTTRAYILNRK
jgi:hypothetical protein